MPTMHANQMETGAGASEKDTEFCPRCGSENVHSSRSRSPGEKIVRALGARMARCHNCDFRFAYARGWIVAARALHAVERGVLAGAGVLAMVLLYWRYRL